MGSALLVLGLTAGLLLPAGAASARRADPPPDGTAGGVATTSPDAGVGVDGTGVGAGAGGDALIGAADPAAYPGQAGDVVENLTDGLLPTRRYRGATRFDTARLIATDAFATPTDAVLARADLFPDALSGSFLAGALDAPILLTGSDRLTGDTVAALNELDPDRVTLVGGEAAIGAEVADQLSQEGFATSRVGGANRFETAAMVATSADADVGRREGHGPTAIVARADEFADALVAGALSYTADFPLLLTGGQQLHPDAAAALQQQAIEHVIVPGGTAAISEPVVGQIEDLGIDVRRVAGQDRVATSVSFAEFMRQELGFGLQRLNTAIGTRFPDALTLGPLSGSAGQPVVLTATEDVLGGGGAVQDFLSQPCVVDEIGIAGGHAAISTALERQIRQLATSGGVPCALSLEPATSGRDLAGDHTATVRVTDNADQPVADQDVRVEVYRASDVQLPDGTDPGDVDLSGLHGVDTSLPLSQMLDEVDRAVSEVDLDVPFGTQQAETLTGTTDASGEVSMSYTGPATPAEDVGVACLDGGPACAQVVDGEPVPDPDVLTDSAITVWASHLDVSDLLLLDPPSTAATSGTSHTVTAIARNADPSTVGEIDGISGFDDPAGLLAQLMDPAALSDVGQLGMGDIGDLAGNLPADVGTPASNQTVRFEVYRATDLIRTTLGDLDELAGLGDLGDTTTLGDAPDVASVLDSVDTAAVLTQLLGELSSGDLRGAVQPLTAGEAITGPDGQATFQYDGPPASSAMDVVVACFPETAGQECASVSGGQLQMPDRPATGVATATWLPAVLTTMSPLAATGEPGGAHTLDTSVLRLDGQPAAGAPVRWDVYRTDETAMVTGLVTQLLDGDALVDEIVDTLVAGSTSELIDQAALEGALAGNLPGALDTTALEGDLTSALTSEIGALDLEALVVQLAEDGQLDSLLSLLDGGGLLGQDATTQQVTLGDDAQTLVDALMGTTEVQGAIEDAVASLTLSDYVDDAALLQGVTTADVLDTAAIDDLIASPDSELVNAVVDLLGGLSVDDLLAQIDPTDVRDAVTGHVTGGVVRADATGSARIGYDGPDVAGLDVIVTCVGQQRDDCAVLDGGGLIATGSTTSVPLAASQLWAGPQATEQALGDLPGLSDQVASQLESLSVEELNVLELVDVNQLGDLATLISDSDQLDLMALAEQVLIGELQELGLIDSAGDLVLSAFESLLDAAGVLDDLLGLL